MSALIETFRSRIVYKSLDAAMTASLRPRRAAISWLGSILDPRQGNYDRIGALVRLCDAIVPGTARRATGLISRRVRPPFAHRRVELLAFGSGSTVFLVEGESCRRVLKIYRRSMGRSAGHLRALVDWYRSKHQTMRSWYASAEGLVWPAEFLVVPGVLLGGPAVACVQPFIEEPARDFFEEFSDAELLGLILGSAELRCRFLAFAARTLEVYRDRGLCPDFLGHRNLIIADAARRPQIHLTDYGVLDAAAARRRGAAWRRMESGIERLRYLLGRAARHEGPPDSPETSRCAPALSV